MKRRHAIWPPAAVLVLLCGPALAQPIGTAFTYQGRLTDAGNPASGAYDLQLILMDAPVGGSQVGPILTRDDVVVTNGLFTTSLDFGAVFTGSKRWLEIGVRPGASTGAYTPLGGRQELTPAPNAAFSLATPWTGVSGKPAGFADDVDNDSGGDITGVTTAPTSGLTGGSTSGNVTLAVDPASIQSRVAGACPAGSSIRVVDQAGTVSCETDDSGWSLTGNAGTNPSTNFLGTTDFQAFEVRAFNLRALRLSYALSPSQEGGESMNVLAGAQYNYATEGAIGATIAGGGAWSSGGAFPNGVTDSFGTVGGGVLNIAGSPGADPEDGRGATVAGGEGNHASGPYSTVAGGSANVATGAYSFGAGGFFNTAGGSTSFAGGRRAKVRTREQVGGGDPDGDQGTFIWADTTDADFLSTGPNQFLIRSAGGVGINTNAPQGQFQIGAPTDSTAFRFGDVGARHHLISNRDMVFNGFDLDSTPNGQSLFIWRKNFAQFNENSSADLMRLADNGTLLVIGNANVTGTLSKGAGSFKIDHPLDPQNKYLYHSFVESPDMMNVYNGNVTTDADGYATVELPEWFEALNRDFRYQLTVIDDGDGWVFAKVAREVRDNSFTLRTSRPATKVSWQVTGIRQDAYANAHRIPVEQDKPDDERGTYLHPDAFER